MAKILVVEDNRQHRVMTTMVLKRCRHEVVEADDAQAGLEAVRQHRPDLVVSDICMPGLTGYDLVSRLRADPTTATLPVILVTGQADVAGLRRGMSLGADDYLPKPFSARDLMGAVETRLRRIRDLVQQQLHLVLQESGAVKGEFPGGPEDAAKPLVWVGGDELAAARSLARIIKMERGVRVRPFAVEDGLAALEAGAGDAGLILQLGGTDSPACAFAAQAVRTLGPSRVVTLVPPEQPELLRQLTVAGCDVVIYQSSLTRKLLRQRLLAPLLGVIGDAARTGTGGLTLPDPSPEAPRPRGREVPRPEVLEWISRGQAQGLSTREASIMGRLAAGDRYQDIAGTLGCSINTIRTHLKRIYRRLGVTCRTTAVARLMQPE